MLGRKQDEIILGAPRKKGRARLVVTALVLVFFAGAVLPHVLSRWAPEPVPGTIADAIFVFTGGENRIATGFRAWREGKAKELYILGAGPEAKLSIILPEGEEIHPDDLPRVHIEGWSENTLENAFSAKSVIVTQGYRNVILVTSDYHAPRATLTLRKVLPRAVSVSVISVPSDWSRNGAWYRLPRIFLVEGWKYWGYRILLPQRG